MKSLVNNVFCIKDNKNGDMIVHKKYHYYAIQIVTGSTDDSDVWLECEPNSMPNNYYGYRYAGELYSDFKYYSEYFTSDVKKIKIFQRKQKLEKLNSL